MSDIAIKVENLSKRYRIGLKEEMHDTLAGAAMDFLRRPVRNIRRLRRLTRFSEGEEEGVIWALRDVSFEVARGEVLGVIGRNGAGKSTLLKILSRITHPSNGRAVINGRVSSLLEVGTGFHPELTGRENVYLNGTILGMRKAEIDGKFEEIVDFSGVEKFIDTPVKFYSSGMGVRLAFSVAAHLEPEILLVDEVLAVGDIGFQKKCLGKMDDIAGSGRTVLFVSHNMGFIAELCGRAILLSEGMIRKNGPTKQVIKNYLTTGKREGSIDLNQWTLERTGDGPMRFLEASTRDSHDNIKTDFTFGENLVIKFSISGNSGNEVIIGVSIRNEYGQLIFHLSNLDDKTTLILQDDITSMSVSISKNILNDGTYYITLWLGDSLNKVHDRIGNCLSFSVDSSIQGRIVSLAPVRIPATWLVSPNVSNSQT
jgi:lipopolysaccharide transport system ATP-binding protein